MPDAIKKRFIRSPMVIFALGACAWSFGRLTIYRAGIPLRRPAPFDIPFFSGSPVSTEFNVAFTLTLLTVAGVVASVVAIFRNRDAWRYFGMVTLALNLLA
jgi:hypothetical protein